MAHCIAFSKGFTARDKGNEQGAGFPSRSSPLHPPSPSSHFPTEALWEEGKALREVMVRAPKEQNKTRLKHSCKFIPGLGEGLFDGEEMG